MEETVKLKVAYKEKVKYATIISQPLASKSTCKMVFKLLKSAINVDKKSIRIGLKDVQRAIRKGEKGFAVFAGDVTPIDIIVHMPAVCEDNEIRYCFTPWKFDIGNAMGLKRPVIAVLIKPNSAYEDLYNLCVQEFSQTPIY